MKVKLANLQNREILVTPNTLKILLDLYHCIARGAFLTFFLVIIGCLGVFSGHLAPPRCQPRLELLMQIMNVQPAKLHNFF